jgi:tRNA threonylcarbamoyladenosine biosynthesis protein TsaE
LKPAKNPTWDAIRQKPVRTFTEEATTEFAREIAGALRAGDRLFLEGELGAGKSSLMREMLSVLGEKTFRGSPSYPLSITYEAKKNHPAIHHMDWYRLKKEGELEMSGLIEVLWDPSVICVIEWGSKFPEVQSELSERFHCVEIQIEIPEDPARNERTYRVSTSDGALKKR